MVQVVDRFQAIVHAPSLLRCDPVQLAEIVRLDEKRLLVQAQTVLRILDREPEIAGLAIRIGDRLHDVQPERLEHRQVRRAEDAVVLVVGRQRLADVVSGEVHHDVEVWRAIHRLPAQPAAHAIQGIHSISFASRVGQMGISDGRVPL